MADGARRLAPGTQGSMLAAPYEIGTATRVVIAQGEPRSSSASPFRKRHARPCAPTKGQRHEQHAGTGRARGSWHQRAAPGQHADVRDAICGEHHAFIAATDAA
jgi:hypothetical protein